MAQANYFHFKGNEKVQIGNGLRMGKKSKSKRKHSEDDKAKKDNEELLFLESPELTEIRGSDLLITEKQLRCIAEKCDKSWRGLMRYLDIDEDQIKRVIQEYMNRGGVPEIVYQLLLDWKRASGEKATVSKMLKELQHNGMNDLWSCLKREPESH